MSERPPNSADPLLPAAIQQEIGKQVREAVDVCRRRFRANSALEEGLTGHLVGELEEKVHGVSGDWSWKVQVDQVSKNLPSGGGEPELGADFVFQVDVFENGINRGHKVLLVQAKKQWSGTDEKLKDQAPRLEKFNGIVADFDPRGYTAVRAQDVVAAGAKRSKIKKGGFTDLGTALGDDFLSCKVGSRDWYVSADGTDIWSNDRTIRIKPVTEYIARLKVKKFTPARRRGLVPGVP